ncbi:MAG: NAD(P)H-hydrate dehydratase, partial [Bacteroidia bacterium]|nr:NAD(P)H-hydrate dehydratase [Bacteroidia bacterium]
QLDAHTIANEPIASIDLMERACEDFVQWFTMQFASPRKIGIICGTGNNGGDGLGIARLLSELNYPVKVWIVRGSAPVTEDFKTNFERIKGRLEMFDIVTTSDQGLFLDRDILIDAIFGSGLSRPVEGIYEQAINCINKSKAVKIAVDVPSGIFTNQPSKGTIVNANHTVAFQVPKLAFLLPENHCYVGDWKVVDIGLSKSFLKEVEAPHLYLVKKSIRDRIRKREKFDHKGTYGHSLLIAGSFGKMGASVLSAKACLRVGVGLLTVHVPASGYSIMQTSVPEAMASVDEHDRFFSGNVEVKPFTSIGVGPGLGQSKETVIAFSRILKLGRPLVIDADGLNILAANPEWINFISEGSILTPHPKEFERLAGGWQNDFQRLEKQKKFSVDTKSIIILKGAHSSIATPDGKVYFNSTGNSGMATGGSGDVLTGILTGLLAQGYSAIDSALVGVYIHGLAGDIAAREKGKQSLIASDLIDFLPAAFKSLTN